MPSALVLLTGATGFLGLHILKQLLESEHQVRVTSRSEEKGKYLKTVFEAHASQISVVVVKDQLAEGAYDEAVQGVDAVVHTASPFIMDANDNKKELIDPARLMAINMLKAAAKSSSVKRVVLTSSMAAVVNPFEGGLLRDYTYTETSWNPVTEDQAEGPALGYLASKTIAEREAWRFVNDQSQFDLVTICPSLIVGPPLQEVKSLDRLNTSLKNVYGLFDLKEVSVNQFPFVVSVEDVAVAHVRAVDVTEAGGRRFLLPGTFFSTQLTIDAIREQYPELRSRMITGTPGKNEFDGVAVCRVDSRPAEQVLGIYAHDWRRSIVEETVPALLRLEQELE